MGSSIKVNRKKRGRPATGRDPVSAVRLPAELTAFVDKWSEDHETNRSEAIRRLVELGLTIRTKAKQPSPLRAARAKELATKAIEKIIDRQAAPVPANAVAAHRPLYGQHEEGARLSEAPALQAKIGAPAHQDAAGGAASHSKWLFSLPA